MTWAKAGGIPRSPACTGIMKENTSHFEMSIFDEKVNTQAAKTKRWQEPPQSEDNCDVGKMEVTAKTTVGVLHELSVGLRVGKLWFLEKYPIHTCFDVAFLVLRSCFFLLAVCGLRVCSWLLLPLLVLVLFLVGVVGGVGVVVVVAAVVTAVRRCVAVLGVLVLGLLLVCVCFSHPTFYCIFEMFCDARVSVQKLGLEWTDVMSSTEARSPAFVFSKANAGRWSPRRLKWEIISCAFSVHIHSRKAGLVEVTSVTAVAPVDDLVTREGGHVSLEILFITLSSTCFQTFHFSLLRFLFYFGKPPKT